VHLPPKINSILVAVVTVLLFNDANFRAMAIRGAWIA